MKNLSIFPACFITKYLRSFAVMMLLLSVTNFARAQSMTLPNVPSYLSGTFNITASITETPKEARLIFTNSTGGSADSGKVWMLISRSSSSSPTFSINPLNLGNSTSSYWALPNNIPMPDGKYVITAQYNRPSNNAVVNSSNSRTTVIDNATTTPEMVTPVSNSYLKNNFVFQSNSNEKILSGSKKLLFVKGSDTTAIVLKNQSDTVTFNINDLGGSSSYNIASASPNNLAEGTYMVILRDQDSSGHSFASDTAFNVTIDTSISAPSIISPAGAASIKSSFNVSFNLPEKAAANSVKILFRKGTENDTLVLSNTAAGNNTVTVYPDHLISSTNVVSASAASLSDGSYTMKLFFTDMVGFTDSAQTSFTLQTDSITALPTLTAPAANATDLTTSHISFTLPENALANSVQVEFIGCNDNKITLNAANAGTYNYAINGSNISGSTGVVSESSNTITSGVYAVLLSYQDANGNARSYALTKNYNYTNGVLGLNFEMLKGHLQLQQTYLQWATASEDNLNYFEVEYSSDAKNFKDIGKVKATGTSFVKENYSFINTAEPLSKNYYRLKMVNDNGSYSYSPVIIIYGANAAEEFKAFPNPASNKLNIMIAASGETGSHTFKIWDMEGKLLKSIPVQVNSGSNLFSISLDELNAGNYVLQDGDNITLFAKAQ